MALVPIGGPLGLLVAPIGFFDDFNDGDLAGWTLVNTSILNYNDTMYVEQDAPLDDPQAYRGLGGTVDSGTRTVSFDIMPASESDGEVVGLENSSGTPVTAAGFRGSDWVVYDGGWNYVGAGDVSATTTFEITLDYSNNTFDFSISDDMGGSSSGGYSFANNVGYERVGIRPNGSSAQAYVGDPTTNTLTTNFDNFDA